MKPLRKLTVLSVIFSLLLTLWAPVAVSAAEPATAQAVAVADAAPTALRDGPLYVGRELLAPLENGATLCYVYDRIIEAIVNGLEYVEFGAGCILTPEEQTTVSSIVNAVIPEGYGDNVGHSYGMVYENYFYSWFYTWGLDATQTAETDQQVKELTADMADQSDFDKSRILYERLVEQNTYDFSDYDQTAYSALCEGTSVCAGYARAYQLLLQEVGIPCLYIPGVADNGYEVGGHAWNLVQLDGQWYYSDATWDDPIGYDGPLTYSFFNMTYDEISVDHTADAELQAWLPHSTAVEANYYYHEGVVCDSLTVQQMADLFLEQNPLMLYVTGDPQTMIDFFIHHYYEVTDIMGLYSFGFVSCRVAGSHGVALIIEYNHVHEDTTADGYCDYCNGPIPPTITPGDLDRNGAVNNRDLGLLQQYINEWSVTIDVTAGDLDGNGQINNRDLGLLQRLLNE